VQLVEPEEIKFFPGQYLDITVPGTQHSRSFSMANVPDRDGRFEFVIKVYPDGMFSHFLANDVQVGDKLAVEGPFGTFTIRESRSSDIVFIAGGAGLAPVLGLLRSMADRGVERKSVFYYGVRTPLDLCFEEELRDLERKLPGFRYVPALSEPVDPAVWHGETGLITNVIRRLEPDLTGRDAYVCGPPPMVEAAITMLADLGVRENDIFYDKFTTTGDTGGEKGP
jgi:propane monooxygenase reductase component